MDSLALFLKVIMEQLLSLLSAEKVKEICDVALDKVEEYVAKTPSKLDDAIVLPLLKKLIREPFGIEDNDEVAK